MKLVELIKKSMKPKRGTLIKIEINRDIVNARFNQKLIELTTPHKAYIKAFLTGVLNELDKP